jgi:signal peptidase II
MRHSAWTYLTASAILISFDQGLKYYLQESTRAFMNEKGSFLFPVSPGLIIIASIVIISVLSHLLFKKTTPRSMTLGLTFIISGGVGNLIDRIIYGYVQDIIAIASARFNLADMYIVMGAVFLLWGVYQDELRSKLSEIE